MLYVLKNGYSVIEEKDNVAFYNFETKENIRSFHINKSHENQIAKLLNNPIDISKLNDVERRYCNSIFANKIMSGYFIQVDKETFFKEKKKYNRINEYVKLNKDAYEMEEWALFSAVKLAVFKTCFCYIGKKDDEHRFDGLNVKYYDNIKNVEISKKNLYIINENNVQHDDIIEFENIAIEEDLARIYIKEDIYKLQLGPALYGKQFGCYSCNNSGNMALLLDEQLSELMVGLLDKELVKLVPNLIECMMDDNTISKGKMFCLNKYDMTACQQDYACNVNCKLCLN